MDVIYTIDGHNIKSEFGIYVSRSAGLLDRPKIKPPKSVNWDDYHGVDVDLSHIYYDSREIVLECFVKAPNAGEFIANVNKFGRLFDAKGLRHLVVEAVAGKPLVYEVYMVDGIKINKEWSDRDMIGTFSIKLIEPEPVKKVLKYSGNGTCSITLTSEKAVNIYWGDGDSANNVRGASQTRTHKYSKQGSHYVVLAGCIDEIENIQTNATVVWERL